MHKILIEDKERRRYADMFRDDGSKTQTLEELNMEEIIFFDGILNNEVPLKKDAIEEFLGEIPKIIFDEKIKVI